MDSRPPFMNLPRELRFQIYSYLLPTGLKFRTTTRTVNYNGSRTTYYHIECKLKQFPDDINYRDYYPRFSKGWAETYGPKTTDDIVPETCETSICRVNREICHETRVLLYNDNVFCFSDRGRHLLRRSSCFLSPQIHLRGPLKQPFVPVTLRLLTNVEFILKIRTTDWHDHARESQRIGQFAMALASRDSAEPAALKTLNLLFDPFQLDAVERNGDSLTIYQTWVRVRYQYLLEPFAQLQHIPNVSVTGVEDWFARCLETRMSGEGEACVLHEIAYPPSVVKTKKRNPYAEVKTKKRKRNPGPVLRSTRTRYQPVFDWVDFAARNGIDGVRPMEDPYRSMTWRSLLDLL